MASQLRVELSGPLFTKPITTTVRGAQNKLVQRVTATGRKNYKDLLIKARGRDSGAYRRTIRGRTKRGVGRVFSTDARKATWLEGTSKLNRRSRFKGYRLFARAADKTDREAGAEARRLGNELARQLGGR